MSASNENAGPSAGPPPGASVLPEMLDRMELIGRRVRLSDGRSGLVVHVEYEAPERVALVKTFPEDPSPLTRVGVDRFSPAHLPMIQAVIHEVIPEVMSSTAAGGTGPGEAPGGGKGHAPRGS